MLYRLDWVRSQLERNEKNRKVYIVEGMFDALRLESMGCLAAAIMGSRLLSNQAVILGRTIKSVNADISFVLYLDSDEAGRKGTVASIKNIWKNDILRYCYLTVTIRECDDKDPDEAYENGNDEKANLYTAFEFLMRYQLTESGEDLAGIQIEKHAAGYKKFWKIYRDLSKRKQASAHTDYSCSSLYNTRSRLLCIWSGILFISRTENSFL